MCEKEHLLSLDESANEEFKFQDEAITKDSPQLANVLKMLKEQSTLIAQLQEQLKSECNKNVMMATKLDLLSHKLETSGAKQNSDLDKRNKEMDMFVQTCEARQELQNTVIDELKFQVQTLRKKMEKNNSGERSPSGHSLKHSIVQDVNSKALLKRFSNDNNSSNPVYLPQIAAFSRGETVWRINSFTKKLRKINAGTFDDPSRSETFATGPHGYRFSLWAYLNGRGKSTGRCLSVFVRIVASEHDAILSWPVKPRYTFSLINQDPDPSNRLDLVRVRDMSVKHNGISRPQKEDKSFIVGFDDFIVHEDIEENNFLLDDSLFIRCTVEIPVHAQ